MLKVRCETNKKTVFQSAQKTHLLFSDAELENIIKNVFSGVFHHLTEQTENTLRMYHCSVIMLIG